MLSALSESKNIKSGTERVKDSPAFISSMKGYSFVPKSGEK